ncbi:hypothetical protein [Streptomyces sp. NPDC003943]
MGVFALFRRKNKDEVATGTEAGAEGTAKVTDGASVTAVDTAEEAPEASDAAAVPGSAEVREVTDEVAEPVEIPKQQSAEEAADNEPAGESARQ